MDIPFKDAVAKFAFNGSPSNPLRRSNRISLSPAKLYKEEEDEMEQLQPPSSSGSPKRKLKREKSEEASPTKKRKQIKRGYAGPSTYAHLDVLTDHLAPDLDGKYNISRVKM